MQPPNHLNAIPNYLYAVPNFPNTVTNYPNIVLNYPITVYSYPMPPQTTQGQIISIEQKLSFHCYIYYYTGVLAVTLATTCFKCSSLDNSCIDNEGKYSKQADHEYNCSSSLLSNDEDGGCSKSKTRTKVLGLWTEIGMFISSSK